MPWLFDEFDFHVVSDEFHPEAFGDCDVVLTSKMLRLRIVHDRGQNLAYLGSSAMADKWWALDFVIEAIHGNKPKPEFALEVVGDRLRQNFAANS